MASSSTPKRDKKFPVPKFHFTVEIDGTEIPFQEVTGLDQEFEFLEYRAGDDPELLKQKRSGLMKTGQISMKKGIFSGDTDVWDVFDPLYSGKGDKYRANNEGLDLTITLMDEAGTTVVTWKVVGAIPTKLTNGDLKGDENAISIEQIDFVFEKITSTVS